MGRFSLGMCLLALGGATQAGLDGEALKRTYTAHELKVPESHLGVAVDAEGRVFSGTLDGVLVFGGTEWERVAIPNRIARQVDAGGDGKVYVGGINTFGVVEPDRAGSWTYRELLSTVGISPENASFGHVSHLEPVANGVMVVAPGMVMEVSAARAEGSRWTIPDGIGRMLVVGGDVYACTDRGLVHFVDRAPRPLPGGDVLAGVRCVAMDEWGGRRVLISDAGLFDVAPSGVTQLADGAAFTDRGPLTNRAVLADGGRVFGFLDGSLLHYGPTRDLVRALQPEAGGVRDLVADREGGLWLGTETGLSRLDYPSSWSVIDAQRGLVGTTNDAAWFDNAWWVASTQGLYRISAVDGADRATLVEGAPQAEMFSLLPGQRSMLVGMVDGLMSVGADGEGRWLLEEEGLSVDGMLASRHVAGRAYAAGVDILLVLRDGDDGWTIAQRIDAPGIASWALAETGPDEVWSGTSDGRFERWRLSSDGTALTDRKTFGASEGLPHIRDRWSLGTYDGMLVASAGNTAWRLSGERFEAYAAPTIGKGTLAELPKLTETSVGVFAAGRDAIALRGERHGDWKAWRFGGLPVLDVNEIREGPDAVVAVALNGLLVYRKDGGQEHATAPLAVSVRWGKVQGAAGTEMVDVTGDMSVRSGDVLDLGFEAVRLGGDVEYRYRAAGTMDAWSDWSSSKHATIPVLRRQPLLVEIEARGADGSTAASRLAIAVAPRWFERIDVQLAAGAVLLALFALLAKIVSDYRLRSQRAYSRELEAQIARRTHEVSEAQQRLDAARMTDPVTEVPNKTAMERGLAREWVRCMDTARPMAVILVDIDHFAQVNEAKGYLGGDEVLRTVGYKLQTLYDPQRELLARYDGAKFVLLLPGVDEEEARKRAARIREVLAENADETSSLGVVMVRPSSATSPDVVLLKMEAALREARGHGRGGIGIVSA